MDMPKTAVKISLKGGPEDSEEKEAPKRVHIERINNGFIVRTCGMDGEDAEFVKKLAKVPSVAARIMGLNGKKSAAEITKMLREEPEED